MSSVLNQHVLVLNRLWQAVNVCTARRALTLLFQGHAQAVLNRSDGSFQTYNFSEWHDFSQQRAAPGIGPHHLLPHPRAARHPAAGVRPPAEEGSQVHAAQHLRARQEHLPVLRQGLRPQGSESRPRDPARPRRADDVGEHRLLVHRVQHAQGQPHAAGGRHASHPQAQAAQVASVRADQLQRCTSTTAGSTSSTWPTGTSSWARMCSRRSREQTGRRLAGRTAKL